MQELNQQEIDLVGGAGLLTGIVLGAQNVISALGAGAYNFGVNLTDTVGLLAIGLVNGVKEVVDGTANVLTGGN
ncbi:hypothetical protein [Burkholderia thailandensis]|uniref:Fructose-specific IIABC component n=2 Tax=Burkholderia thailandensis TaxID=57975 RepID=A0AAW9CVY8_BURTH|nr:hypothetical protein [Burkholderia thailandensis]ABC37444.1 fructose-specific IIABC component [Burkholderia thailandensis E264]AHI66018.1 putative fructose-specific IIABC component [Burkholderia thailandensis H0587]AHI72632.1 putative fructose-specific IIABC component [Burkholderia thailandensis 2002721723]AHI79823.1 putative fructose-specific IIABC component [Burkholderia thailandensis E444]AIC88805.1 putative fructose-specific IIABC component [Burkholderia thailandensis USAMRU Malaysia \